MKACHAFLDAGDALVVPSLDRYGRSLQDLINMVAELRERGIGFTSLHENLDTTTPGGRLVFHVFAALAEFIFCTATTRARRPSVVRFPGARACLAARASPA
ncbi:recombinase family protein [Wenjunlia tyrosinilytica]|uniref:recombinase family protein n=1 Tax=Wenjunlia tyrosinilytica TaxID=1544741 RepID=UPI004032AB6F